MQYQVSTNKNMQSENKIRKYRLRAKLAVMIMVSSVLLTSGICSTYATDLHFFHVNTSDTGATSSELEGEVSTNYNNDGAPDENAMAIGYIARTKGKNALAVGYNTAAYAENALAIGHMAHAEGNNSLSIGYNSRIENLKKDINGQERTIYSFDSVALGYQTSIIGSSESIAIGMETSVNDAGRFNIAMGYQATVTADANELKTVTNIAPVEAGSQEVSGYSIAIGNGTKASDQVGTAIGASSRAVGKYATALGVQAYGKGEHSLAMSGAAALGQDSVAIMGGTTSSNARGAIAIGGNTSRMLDPEVPLFEVSNHAQSYAEGAVAIGVGTKAMSAHTLALSQGKAAGNHAIAIGGMTGNIEPISDQEDSLEDYGALYDDYKIVDSADNAVAVGHQSHARKKDAVALGSHSIASVAEGVNGYNPLERYNFAYDKNSPTWKSTYAAFSIGHGDGSATRQITGVAAGSQDTDAVNVAQLKAAMVTLEADEGISLTRTYSLEKGTTYKIKLNLEGGTTETADVHVKPKASAAGSSAAHDKLKGTTMQVTADTASGGNHGDATLFAADKGNPTAVNPTETLNLNGDTNITTTSSDHKIAISLNKDLKELNSVTATTMNANTVNVDKAVNVAGKTYISQKGLNANGRKITNVATGVADTDAVNVGQLKQGLTQNYNSLSNKINKVGAGAAAMAMLHPLDFDPDDKWSFSASVGHYKGENAVALGAFYRPNEDTMVSLGGSVGNGDDMVAGSVSWKFSQKNHISVNRVSTAKEILELRKALEDLRSLIADGVAGRNLDLSKIEIFPDVPENHWAYDYVATLAGNGVLEGYPDGYFNGNRQMTRYEMAAVIYRAMMNGAKINAKALKEFEPELDRFRVDTISYNEDGTPDIQRVRTIESRK